MSTLHAGRTASRVEVRQGCLNILTSQWLTVNLPVGNHEDLFDQEQLLRLIFAARQIVSNVACMSQAGDLDGDLNLGQESFLRPRWDAAAVREQQSSGRSEVPGQDYRDQPSAEFVGWSQ